MFSVEFQIPGPNGNILRVFGHPEYIPDFSGRVAAIEIDKVVSLDATGEEIEVTLDDLVEACIQASFRIVELEDQLIWRFLNAKD